MPDRAESFDLREIKILTKGLDELAKKVENLERRIEELESK